MYYVFENSIPFRKKDLLRINILEYRASRSFHRPCTLCSHRGRGCLCAAAPVTGAAADEYNLTVVDRNASVTVERRSS
jgi:hypothetical protein